MSVFWGAAVFNAIICACLGVATRSKIDKDSVPAGFPSHLRRYLVAWTLCIAGEWFCGPGVYALYSSYGFENAVIAKLFVLGFACSSVLGCVAGSFADRFGRKRSALLFCSFGICACTLKHFAWYPALILARFLDGAHASLLYTAFESWLVAEHFQRHSFPGELLGHSFALMFTISYLVAVVCGFVAQLGVDSIPAAPPIGALHLGGWAVPFEMSAVFQAFGFVYIALNWDENYGTSEATTRDSPENSKGLWRTFFSVKVMLCCALVSFFESTMFIFVFSWTPALSPNSDHALLPAGLIFAVYMMACMSGASVYRLCVGFSTRTVMLAVFFLAAAAFAVPAFVGISEESKYTNFFAFVLFEFTVGAYFPAAASLKSEFVEERYRTTIYNLFRTPMNLIVVLVLLTGPPLTLTFQLLFAQLSLGVLMLLCYSLAEARGMSEKSAPLLQEGNGSA